MTPIPLLCLPFAGAGASFFRSWQAACGGDLEIIPLQLPGREQRFAESPCTTVAEAVQAVFPEALEAIGDRREIALFGHSLGAVIAFELALELERSESLQAGHLIVSGSPGPWIQRASRATELTDDDFVARVQEFAGYSHAAIEDADMREVLLPTLRADVEMHENYVPSSVHQLSASVLAVRGQDDTLVGEDEVLTWQKVSTGEFALMELPGGHMYLTDAAPALLAAIARTVKARQA